MMNTLQSFQDRPSSFVGAVKQLSGLGVGSSRMGGGWGGEGMEGGHSRP